MKKTALIPPEEWPIEAQGLYHAFAAKLAQKLVNGRDILRFLYHFCHAQQRAGLSFRDFPQTFVDGHLSGLTLRNRDAAAYALRKWLRFLFSRRELILPLHEQLIWPATGVYPRRVLLSHPQMLEVLRLPDLNDPEGLRDRAFLEVAYGSGLRRHELVDLDLSDVDLALGQVSIRRAKNGCQCNVPLTRWAQYYLTRYLEQARPQLTSPLSLNALWLGKRGRRLHLDQLGIRFRYVYRVRETLGFSVTMHLLRHACATHLLQNGAELSFVSELLGHQDLDSTEVYTHLTLTYLQQVHQRCHPRNNGQMAPGAPAEIRNLPGHEGRELE